ncbi:MAG: SPOR domain-containing protein, partial [Candidatus Peribacteraceae bacterium]|nr:SPOR domain-containing protein [Candidatus Peribacteraceae bacterium]
MLFSLLTGCNSTQPTAIENSLKEYDNGEWVLSEMWAKKSIKENKSIGEAQYMMGLCEFKQNKMSEAQDWFNKATTSSSQEARGKATAMIGIIASANGDYVAAQAAFALAAPKLIGDDREKAEARSTVTTSIHSDSKTSFTLQFGAFRDRANANSTLTAITPSLKNVGIAPVWITEEISRSGGTLYLVQA